MSFLRSFDTTLNMVNDGKNCILVLSGGWIAPVLSPQGFGDWKCPLPLSVSSWRKKVCQRFLCFMAAHRSWRARGHHSPLAPLIDGVGERPKRSEWFVRVVGWHRFACQPGARFNLAALVEAGAVGGFAAFGGH